MNTGLLHVKLPIIPHLLAIKILSQKLYLCISPAYTTIYQAKDTVNATLECILRKSVLFKPSLKQVVQTRLTVNKSN